MATSPGQLPEGTDSIISDAAVDPVADVVEETTEAASDKAAAFRQKFADATEGFRTQAGEKAHAFAVDGKDRATSLLDNLAKMVSDAADNVDQQIGPQYGAYARQAADLVSGFSSQLQSKDVDELIANANDFVRKSPVVAIGTAAAIGFVLVRLARAGLSPAETAASTEAADTPPAVPV